MKATAGSVPDVPGAPNARGVRLGGGVARRDQKAEDGLAGCQAQPEVVVGTAPGSERSRLLASSPPPPPRARNACRSRRCLGAPRKVCVQRKSAAVRGKGARIRACRIGEPVGPCAVTDSGMGWQSVRGTATGRHANVARRPFRSIRRRPISRLIESVGGSWQRQTSSPVVRDLLGPCDRQEGRAAPLARMGRAGLTADPQDRRRHPGALPEQSLFSGLRRFSYVGQSVGPHH